MRLSENEIHNRLDGEFCKFNIKPACHHLKTAHFDGYTTTKTLICPGWETAVVPVSQPGMPVRDKRRCPFVLGVATGTKGLFFFLHVFLFSILFLFQLYFCISIKLMYWNSVCMISTNIYIYIYSYLYNICPR